MNDLISNIESYHFGKGMPQGYFSEQQTDRLCDVISQSTEGMDRSATRGSECGKYVFFGGPITAAGNPQGSSKNPHGTLSNAHTAATSRAIIIGRPGTYSLNGTPVRAAA